MISGKTIGETIRKIRAKLGLTQDDLARKAGIKNITLTKIESGVVNKPRIQTVVKIAKALGISIEVLLNKSVTMSKEDTNHTDKHNSDLVAIKKIASDWRAGWNNGDANALLSLYAENPVLLPQGQPAIIGKETIRTMYKAVFRDYIIRSRGKLVVKAEASGNLGYFWSPYTLTAKSRAGGKAITSRGKSLFIVKRQEDHTWKIVCLMDNSDEES